MDNLALGFIKAAMKEGYSYGEALDIYKYARTRPNIIRPTFIRPNIERPTTNRPSIKRTPDLKRPDDLQRTPDLQRPPDIQRPPPIARPEINHTPMTAAPLASLDQGVMGLGPGRFTAKPTMKTGAYKENRSYFVENDQEYKLNDIFKKIRTAPVKRIRVSELNWMFDNANTSVDAERLTKAQPEYPIVTSDYRKHKIVVDGLHRSLKARVQDRKTILAKHIARKDLESIPHTKVKRAEAGPLFNDPPKFEDKAKHNKYSINYKDKEIARVYHKIRTKNPSGVYIEPNYENKAEGIGFLSKLLLSHPLLLRKLKVKPQGKIHSTGLHSAAARLGLLEE